VSQEKATMIKQQTLKLLCEALYLGIAKEELLSLVETAEQLVKGAKTND